MLLWKHHRRWIGHCDRWAMLYDLWWECVDHLWWAERAELLSVCDTLHDLKSEFKRYQNYIDHF